MDSGRSVNRRPGPRTPINNDRFYATTDLRIITIENEPSEGVRSSSRGMSVVVERALRRGEGGRVEARY